MADRFPFADRLDEGTAPVVVGAPRWHGPAPTGSAVRFSYPRLEPAAPAVPPAASAPAPEAPPAAACSEAELTAAVAAARREGYAEAEANVRAELLASLEQRRVEALAAISAAAIAGQEALGQALAARATASRDLALAVGRALAGRALALQPLADVEAMVEEVLVRLEGEPWLELRLPPDLTAAGEAALARAAAAAGYRGQLRVVAEAGLDPGDARLVWQEGAAERDIARLEAEAAALVEAWLPSPAPPEDHDARTNGCDR